MIKRGTSETEELTEQVASDNDADAEAQENKISEPFSEENISTSGIVINEEAIPEYVDEPYVQVNYNEPFFTESELKTESYESLSELDELGRCGVAEACVGIDIIPDEERGEIGDIKPSGWRIVKYDGVVEDEYLYNRCHLIDYQLTGENSDIRNFITGTEYMNIEGMLPFENMVARYVEMTGNHVMYRVTPVYKEDNLVATGVLMEACSVEDNGMGVYYNVFVYNVQPGVEIDYSTGDSRLK
ncbi:MAG: DNA/RNA non-specific endonuclease [Lachnospiraceae bacterium]|nr:DNA/RNA non-specific endonuclease [Lachnospiraceae bacterium]